MKSVQYQGLLTFKQAADGMNAATANALSLFEDGKLLLEHNRYARAAALFILAIEEMGKLSIIRLIVLQETSEQAKKEWKQYRSHASKNVMWVLPEMVYEGARGLDDFAKMFTDKEDSYKLDSIKQLSFYTDCIRDGVWSSPDTNIDFEVAKGICSIAEILIQPGKSKVISEKEIEIWVKHLKPTLVEGRLSKAALIDCYKEWEGLGLIRTGAAQEMTNFVLGKKN